MHLLKAIWNYDFKWSIRIFDDHISAYHEWTNSTITYKYYYFTQQASNSTGSPLISQCIMVVSTQFPIGENLYFGLSRYFQIWLSSILPCWFFSNLTACLFLILKFQRKNSIFHALKQKLVQKIKKSVILVRFFSSKVNYAYF